jgi:uncharacterized protein YndB with AHSA1/START domain
MIALAERLDRTLIIHARREVVFRFLTDSPRWADWWGAGSTIDARPGGQMRIRHSNGVEVTGEVLHVDAPERIAFTYGYASGAPIPPGGSRVTIRLDPHPQGTLLQVTHEFADARVRDEFVQGWRYQLSLFANVIANAASAEAAALVDAWLATWSDPDTATREASLARIAAADLEFQDKFSCVTGLDDLRAHLAAVHRFMPGLRLERRGEIRHCQWQVLADWAAVAADGQERGRGTNLFVIDADQRLTRVTGFWAS